jgi:hypothetical protein
MLFLSSWVPTSFISSPDPTVFSDNKKVAIYIFQSAKLPCVNCGTDSRIFSFAFFKKLQFLKGLSHEMDLAVWLCDFAVSVPGLNRGRGLFLNFLDASMIL